MGGLDSGQVPKGLGEVAERRKAGADPVAGLDKWKVFLKEQRRRFFTR